MLSEITDNSNRSRAFAMIGLGPSVGSLVGGGMGGLLAEPADKYPIMNVAFFRAYPYALPVFAAGAINLVSCVLGYFYLHETLSSKIENSQLSVQSRGFSFSKTTTVSETDPLLENINIVLPQRKIKHSMKDILTSSYVVQPMILTFLDAFCQAFYTTILTL